ncbi:MAG: NACHT domain-containing protein [Egibacteraceae bacterium]
MPAVARRWLLMAVLLVTGAVVLALWATPPSWLAGPRGVTVTARRWARTHLLNVAFASLLAGTAALILPFWLRRLERREATEPHRQSRDRVVMLQRVRRRWITGVLEQSSANEVRIRLGLTRRPDAVLQGDVLLRRPHGGREPLPAGTPLTQVFDEAGGGLLILGSPGSGKTTALLALARDLLDRAAADHTRPIPVVFNLSSWAPQQPALAEWLVDELHKRYDVARSIGQRWVDGGEILPLLDGLDEVARSHRADCVKAINAFQGRRGPERFVVCTRTHEYAALATQLRVEEAIELGPPTRQQVRTYLEATGAALGDVQAALEADPTLWELLQSPLVLSIVALTYQDRSADALRTAGTAEQRLTALFDAYTQRMLERRPITARYTPDRMLHWLPSSPERCVTAARASSRSTASRRIGCRATPSGGARSSAYSTPQSPPGWLRG